MTDDDDTTTYEPNPGRHVRNDEDATIDTDGMGDDDNDANGDEADDGPTADGEGVTA
jgi:hypothetical protein